MTDNQTPQQTKLLICGSRHGVTETMRNYSIAITERAIELGWMVYAGDARGVDACVAIVFSMTSSKTLVRLVIAGLAPHQRHNEGGAYSFIDYVRLPVKTYTERDRYMVINSDKVMCIWNGKSTNSGTYKNFLYACDLNKQAWLVNQHGKIIKINQP